MLTFDWSDRVREWIPREFCFLNSGGQDSILPLLNVERILSSRKDEIFTYGRSFKVANPAEEATESKHTILRTHREQAPPHPS